MEGMMQRCLIAACGLLLAGAAPLAHAVRITVDTLDDVSTVRCTLRDAMIAATNNAATGACPAGDADGVAEDEIVFDTALFAGEGQRTLTLNSSLPSLKGRVAISGPGAQSLMVRRADEAPFFRILTVEGGRTRLSAVTLANGAVMDDQGGGIRSSGDLEIARCIVEGNQAVRSARPGTVFNINPTGGGVYFRGSTLSIVDSRIANNRTVASHQAPGDDGGGGGIYVAEGTLTMLRSSVVGNRTGAGGGGIHGGAMTIESSEIAFNQASSGGGLFAGESPRIRTSAIHDNVATDEGGGMIVYGDDILLERLSVYGNRAGRSGGGIMVRTFENDQFRLVNSMLHGNRADMNGGGIGIDSKSLFDRLNLSHNTITNNRAGVGGGLDLFVSNDALENGLTLAANLIAGNSADMSPDVDADLNGAPARNLFGDRSGIGNFQPRDLVAEARLGPLLDDGLARVQTILPASPAINATDCYDVSEDQTGGPRPLDGKCEIGAHEFRGRLEQSLRFDAPSDRLLSEGAFQVIVAATRPLGSDATGRLNLVTLTPLVCAASGWMVTPLAVGSCVLEVSLPAEGGGAGLPRMAVQRSLQISSAHTKITQGIEFPALSDRVLSDPPQALKAVTSSGLPVRYAAQGPCSLSGNTVIAGGASGTGICIVTSTQEGNAEYAPAVPVTRSFTVHPDGNTAAIVVTTLDDTSTTHCSLRDAIRSANDNVVRGACSAGDPNPLVTDRIVFESGLFDGTPKQLLLASALPALRDRVELIGPGPDQLDLHRGYGYGTPQTRFRILAVASGANATVEGLTLSGGVVGAMPRGAPGSRASDPGHGGGVNNDGTLTLRHCAVRNNKAYAGFVPTGDRVGYSSPGSGGGIYSRGALVIENCEITGNEAVIGDGGGIHAFNSLSVSNSLIANNNAAGQINKQPYVVQDSAGGGLRSEGPLTITNSTITGNRADGAGAGVASFGSVTLLHATISGNSSYRLRPDLVASGGIHAQGGGTVTNSVIAGNIEEGTSLLSNLHGNLTQSGSNRIDGDAELATLAHNGGLTRTFMPRTGSSLIDAAPCLEGVTLDQRGQPRPGANSVGGLCDIGAVEVQKGAASSGADQYIDFPIIGSHVPGIPFMLEAHASSGLPLRFAAGPTSVCTVAGNVLMPIALGACTITASQAGNAEFAAAADVSQSFEVELPVLLEQVIVFTSAAPSTAQVGDIYDVVATGGASGNPVILSIAAADTGNVCTLEPGSHSVRFVAEGVCTINADQIGNVRYAPALQVRQNVRVAALVRPVPPQLISADDGTIVGTAVPKSTVEVFDGVISLGVVVAEVDGRFLLSQVLSTGPHRLTAKASNRGGTSDASLALVLDIPLFDGPVGGSKAERVRITSDMNGCALQGAAPQWGEAPGPLPAYAAAPLGALAFTAITCPGGTLTVQVDYPEGSLADLTAYKYGPHGWFAHGKSDTDSGRVTYTVTDGDAGDGNSVAGVIQDPHAMLQISAAPAALQPVPMLSAWSMALLTAFAVLLGWSGLRRPGGASNPH